ncbi:D-alanyl-D-alanine carboxypeptidase family protein [Promicromonospora sp. NPDC057138]|uniref:M15 family metallopeptidase n=1 Tax=Promicromonospora sp. NPDC057138 TaxID=3346031 RepID=UPI00362D6707
MATSDSPEPGAIQQAARDVEKAATAAGTATGSPVLGRVAGVLASGTARSLTGRRISKVAAAVLVSALVAAIAVPVLTVMLAVHGATVLFDADGDDGGYVAAQACFAGSGVEAGLSDEQAQVAEAVLAEIAERDLPAQDAVIAIMTGLTESGLRSLEHGDEAGPDSRGVFQQRAPWGSLEERLDPRAATGLFLDALTNKNLRLYGTSELLNSRDGSRYDVRPWLVAQSVQRSAFDDGRNYRANYEEAVGVVAAMLGPDAVAEAEPERWGVALPQGDSTATGTSCSEDSSVGAATGGWGGFENGRIPIDQLCELSFAVGHYARCDAASAVEELSTAFREEFGTDLEVTDSYRSYEQQVVTKRAKGHLAAVPGTSNHGWGTALDLGGGINRFGTTQHRWMQENAGRFGWVHPEWAQADGAKPEPWHWEFKGCPTRRACN